MTKFRNALKDRRRNVIGALMVATGSALTASTQALAVAEYDLTPATTGIKEQIAAVLTVVLPIAGGVVALFVGWKMLKRFVAA
jgi:hypothetical protein